MKGRKLIEEIKKYDETISKEILEINNKKIDLEKQNKEIIKEIEENDKNIKICKKDKIFTRTAHLISILLIIGSLALFFTPFSILGIFLFLITAFMEYFVFETCKDSIKRNNNKIEESSSNIEILKNKIDENNFKKQKLENELKSLKEKKKLFVKELKNMLLENEVKTKNTKKDKNVKVETKENKIQNNNDELIK